MRSTARIAVALCVVVCMSSHAHAFLPRFFRAPAAPAPAAPPTNECPSEVIAKLQSLSFESLKSVCPTRSDVPNDLAMCADCSCGVYQLIKEAVGGANQEIYKLAEACGSIFSLDTAFDGLNTKAVVDFLHLCKDLPGSDQQIDFKTCETQDVNAMSGPSDNISANDMLSFLKTDLNGLTQDEMVQFLGIAEGMDLADNSQGLADDVFNTVAEVENLVRLINLGTDVIPESLNDSSILCPGFTSPGSCESFDELRRICPWSCERQKEECAFASPKTCETLAFQESCPVTCRQISILSSDLPISLEGAIQITSLTDGSAIKAHNMRGTVENDCMCFNVFQPVCHAETNEMFVNLCEAKCQGHEGKTESCRKESMEAVKMFAATSSNLTPEEIDSLTENWQAQAHHRHNHHHNAAMAEDNKAGDEIPNSAFSTATSFLVPLALAAVLNLSLA